MKNDKEAIRTYFPDGKLKSELFGDEKNPSRYIEYYHNGNIKIEKHSFLAGNSSCKSYYVEYYENGDKKKEIEGTLGLIFTTTYYLDGSRKEECDNRDKEEHTIYVYYPNGKLKSSKKIYIKDDNKKDDDCTYSEFMEYYENGRLKKTEEDNYFGFICCEYDINENEINRYGYGDPTKAKKKSSFSKIRRK